MTIIDDGIVQLRGSIYSGSGDWLDQSSSGDHDAAPREAPTHSVDHWIMGGSAERLEITDNAALDFGATDSFSVMMRLALPDNGTTWQGVFNKGGTGTDERYTVEIRGSSGAGGVRFSIGDGAASVLEDGATVVDDDVIFTLCIVRNVTDDDLEIFIDGVSEGSPTTDSTTASLANAAHLELGRDGGGAYLVGDIYDFILWDKALTAAEALTAHGLLAGTAAIVTPGVIATSIVVNTPTLIGPGVVTPNQIAPPIALNTPTLSNSDGTTVTPAPVVPVLTLNTPTTAGPAVVTPAQVNAVLAMLTPTPVGPAIVGPAEVSLAAVLNTPTLVGGGVATPGLIAVVAVLNTPTTSNTDVGGATFFGIYGVGQVLET